jgi:hypothetical protein
MARGAVMYDGPVKLFVSARGGTKLARSGPSWGRQSVLEEDVVAPKQRWLAPAIAQAVRTSHGPMISAPFLVIAKLWDARGSQDETDVLGVLSRMTDSDLNATRQLVRQYLPDDFDDLESLISIRNF